MKKFIKQLFCDHIYKDVEMIEKIRTFNRYHILIKSWMAYDEYLVKRRCLLCGKEILSAEEYLVDKVK
jgi:hypothetical protein